MGNSVTGVRIVPASRFVEYFFNIILVILKTDHADFETKKNFKANTMKHSSTFGGEAVLFYKKNEKKPVIINTNSFGGGR